ncbi:unnamed protein product [Bemisia tabaci]|uniref:Apoptosis inhibitor 5 n=1 Tax=Bemisia tabaci TaxID=7038 RepID=A0A9P0AB56_BEMTA|nr:unnamed protein product [Bemisia tabaci]
MSTDSIEKLYKNFGVLADAKDKIGEHEAEYLEILTAVKGTSNEKRLASQFIARFFKHFPNLVDQALEAQFDLCEDEDISIRKQAIKDLPSLCKDNKEQVPKIADILAQLLQAEDPTERSVVQSSFMTLFKVDAKSAVTGLFNQILTGDDTVREQCIKFLYSKAKTLGADFIPKEIEDELIALCKKVLQDCTADEFVMLMELLGGTKLGKTVSGHKEIIDIISEQAEIGDENFNPQDEEQVDKLVHSIRHALPYFSSQLNSSRFVEYMCNHVLPQLDKISPSKEGPDSKLELLKLFAELCTHSPTLPNIETNLEKVFAALTNFMPLPPVEEETISEPKIEFSHVECLIYAFHRLSRQSQDFLTKDAERMRNFKIRLQYLARGTQGYLKKLKESVEGKSSEDLKSEECKIKVLALKTTNNINTIIKDLFHVPPSFKTNVNLSWRPTVSTTKSSAATTNGTAVKRHKPITFDSSPSAKLAKTDAKVYTPPSGKFSNTVSSYSPAQSNFRSGRRPRGRAPVRRGSSSGNSFRLRPSRGRLPSKNWRY